MTLKEAIGETTNNTSESELLKDAFFEIAGGKEGIDTRYLGNFINKHRDRVIGGLKLKHAGTYKHAAKWKIEEVDPVNSFFDKDDGATE